MALTRGCRLAYMAGLILGVLGLLGAQGGSLTEPPATSLLKIPVPGARHKPPVQFSHRVHKARPGEWPAPNAITTTRESATSGMRGSRWKSARPATA